MTQMTLTEEAGDGLRSLAAEMNGVLLAGSGDTVAREIVERWSQELKTILAGRVPHHPRKRPSAT